MMTFPSDKNVSPIGGKRGEYERRKRLLRPLLQQVSATYGMTDSEMADELGVTYAQVHAWIEGKHGPKRKDVLEAAVERCTYLLDNVPPAYVQQRRHKKATPPVIEDDGWHENIVRAYLLGLATPIAAAVIVIGASTWIG
ncbi:MAG: helix-turn-helix domain-containing protein [Alphaproteobacteria bacterium]